MDDLRPNDPRKRFEFVLKQWWNKSYKGESLDAAVLDAFYVTTSLLGSHGLVADRIMAHAPGDLTVKYQIDEPEIERIQKILDLPSPTTGSATVRFRAANARATLARLGHPYEYDDRGIIAWGVEQWGLADLVLTATKLPDASSDFLIPWIAREIVKLAKAVMDGRSRHASTGALPLVERLRTVGVSPSDYFDAVHALYDKAPAIAQWAKETRTDIGKADLAQALEAIGTYKFKTSLVEQGHVVYTFKDGWTVQELRTELALSQEGNNMQNCIAGYFNEVMDSTTRIYSIRDASGAPHVSMELVIPGGVPRVQASDMSPEEFIESRTRLDCYFAQILGKQNDMPIDEYRARAREFIDKVFDKEGLGWVIAGGTPAWGRFESRRWQDVDFSSIFDTNHVDGEGVLAETIFDDTTVDRCKFENLVGPRSFARAKISDTSFQGAVLHEVNFEGVKGYFVDFRSAVLSDASFDSAHLGGSDFRRSTISGANFRDAHVDGVNFDGAQGGASANWEGVELTTGQKGQLGLPLSAQEEAEKKTLRLDWRSKR